MKSRIIYVFILLVIPVITLGQTYYQYFDGADTSQYNSIFINLDTTLSNIWQIGSPQKTIFDSASTRPNALITDTINTYPVNDTSIFQYSLKTWSWWGILAIQWNQKLDMDHGSDGGIIEFSIDSGETWQSAFDNPYVYNFYGFDSSNVDTLPSGDIAFTGTDSMWQNVWLCFDMSWLQYEDSFIVRHTFVSDSKDNNREGWMIDNMLVNITIVHTINEVEQKEYMKIHPNPTSGRINIKTRKIESLHLIEEIQLIDAGGKVVQKWGASPTKFYIDIGDHPNGIYFLKVRTNLQTETFQVILQKE